MAAVAMAGSVPANVLALFGLWKLQRPIMTPVFYAFNRIHAAWSYETSLLPEHETKSKPRIRHRVARLVSQSPVTIWPEISEPLPSMSPSTFWDRSKSLRLCLDPFWSSSFWPSSLLWSCTVARNERKSARCRYIVLVPNESGNERRDEVDSTFCHFDF